MGDKNPNKLKKKKKEKVVDATVVQPTVGTEKEIAKKPDKRKY